MDYFNFEFPVKSKLYGTTQCVVNDLDKAIKTGFAPCGDGNDYKFSKTELARLKSLAHNRMFITDRDMKAVRKAIFELIKGSGSVKAYSAANKVLDDIKVSYGWNDFQKQALVTELSLELLNA